jgi:hypothetical protein
MIRTKQRDGILQTGGKDTPSTYKTDDVALLRLMAVEKHSERNAFRSVYLLCIQVRIPCPKSIVALEQHQQQVPLQK